MSKAMQDKARAGTDREIPGNDGTIFLLLFFLNNHI